MIVQITANLRILLVLAALMAAGALILQQRELSRLRMAIEELARSRSEQPAISTDPDAFPADTNGPRREAAEIQRLRAEVAQLRREKMETSALQASIEKLAMEVSTSLENLNHRPASMFTLGSSPTSVVVSKAASLAQSSPEEAAHWVAALPADEDQNQAALAVIDQWIGSDPVAAAAWTTQFTEGPLRGQAMARVGREWGLRDWNATAQWLETLPAGSSKDSAIGAFVTAADGYDIKLAAEWANRMEDPESRAAQVTGMAQRWLREDNAAARAWIQKAQLPAGIASRLLSGQ